MPPKRTWEDNEELDDSRESNIDTPPKRTWENDKKIDNSRENNNTIIIQNSNSLESASAGCGGCLEGCGTIFGMLIFLGFLLALTDTFGPIVMMFGGFIFGVFGGGVIYGFISGNPVQLTQINEYLEEISAALDSGQDWVEWDPALKQRIYWMGSCGVACAIGGLIIAQ